MKRAEVEKGRLLIQALLFHLLLSPFLFPRFKNRLMRLLCRLGSSDLKHHKTKEVKKNFHTTKLILNFSSGIVLTSIQTTWPWVMFGLTRRLFWPQMCNVLRSLQSANVTDWCTMHKYICGFWSFDTYCYNKIHHCSFCSCWSKLSKGQYLPMVGMVRDYFSKFKFV